jgi:hypothetical protein
MYFSPLAESSEDEHGTFPFPFPRDTWRGMKRPWLPTPLPSTTKPVPKRRNGAEVANSVALGLVLGAVFGGLALGIASIANSVGGVPYPRALGVWLDTAILVPLAAFVCPRMEPFGKEGEYRPELRQIICLQFLVGLLGGVLGAYRWLDNHGSQIRVLNFVSPWIPWLAAILLASVGLLVAARASRGVRAVLVALAFIGLVAVAVCDPLLFGLVGESKSSVMAALALAGGLAGLGTGPEKMAICGPPGKYPAHLGALILPALVVLAVSGLEFNPASVLGILIGVLALILGLVGLFCMYGGWALLILIGVYVIAMLPYTRACRWLVSWRRW